jgi:uncharacterized protein YdeI (YjbR/CyaY-like superfamily)
VREPPPVVAGFAEDDMGTHDDRVDAYISRAQEFARPILTHLRTLVHSACPGANETIKWGFPHFEYEGVLCSMAAFKAHCAFGFWHAQMRELGGDKSGGEAAMGQFGRITKLGDLPKDAALKTLIRKAAAINESGVRPARVTKPKSAPLGVPDDLAAALKRHRAAAANFDAMSPSHRREYIEWLVEAKREETRSKRLATAIEWIAQGKSKEWKYRGS